MSLQEQLTKLAEQKSYPSVTISFNTHRTSPDNLQDAIKLKNAVKEAEERLLKEFDNKRDIAEVLQKLSDVLDDIDVSKNIESLHVFISKDTLEIVRTTWPVINEGVWIDDKFAIRPLIKAVNRTEEYLVLYLTQKGVHLYEAKDDIIENEITNEDFPFTESKYNLNHVFADLRTDSLQENRLKNFINQVDKAVQRIDTTYSTPVLVVSVADNYSYLLDQADQPSIYIGNVSADFNSPTQKHEFMADAWEFIKQRQHQNRTLAIEEMQEAISKGQVLTDLQEIYQASIDGRGDLLIVHQDYEQPVRMIDDRTFELVDDPTEIDVIDDITSNIAWDVISKKGRAIFTSQDEIKELGKIVLKTRY